MRNYIVTGCGGFIGSRVTETLIGQGHFVFGIDNLNQRNNDLQLKMKRMVLLLAVLPMEDLVKSLTVRN